MKTTEFLSYEAPQVEIVEVEVENGFAVSGVENNPLNNNDWRPVE